MALSECWIRTSLKIDKNLCKLYGDARLDTEEKDRKTHSYLIWLNQSSTFRRSNKVFARQRRCPWCCVGTDVQISTVSWHDGGLVRSWKASLNLAWMGRWDFPLQPSRSCWSALFRCDQCMNTLIHYGWFALSTGHEADASVLPCATWIFIAIVHQLCFVNAVNSCHNQVVRPTTMTQNLTISSGEVTSLIAMFPSHPS